MTIKEAILSFPGLSDLPDDYITKVLVDRSIANDGAATYAIDDRTTVALCAADSYVAVVNNPDFSEGRLSIKMTRGYILNTAAQLYRDHGESSNADKLTIGEGNAKAKWW